MHICKRGLYIWHMNNEQNIQKAQGILNQHGVRVLTEIGIELANTVQEMKDNMGNFKPGSKQRGEQWQELYAAVQMLNACKHVLGDRVILTRPYISAEVART